MTNNHLYRLIRLLIIIVATPAIVICCNGIFKKRPSDHDFQQIVKRDTLTALTLNSSVSYFIYRDQPMGFHFDMIKSFCDNHGLGLKIKTAANPNALINMLIDGEGDVIAYDIPVTKMRKEPIIYCGLSQVSHQVLVQRAEKNDTLLTDVTQLIGKEIFVASHTKYEQRVKNLNMELGGGIAVRDVEEDTVVVEDLVRMVSTGEIKYTVADEYIAKMNKTYFHNIDISLPVSFEQRSSWVVRKDAPELADSLNKWYAKENIAPTYRRITKRYFEEAKGFEAVSNSSYLALLAPGQISPYDEYFKKSGKQFGIDWRLLASVAYYESTFNPDGQAWTGAGGLMGLMPPTAVSLGLNEYELFNPEKNIQAGATYLRKMMRWFSAVPDPNERIKMALAAYNAGAGHIFDAQALAEKYEADKDVWDDNVERYLHLKRVEKYYKDPVCRLGYFRGDETINYVQNVMSRWERYKETIK